MSMAPSARDLGRVYDMLDFAQRAFDHMQGLDEAGFGRSPLHQDAVIRALSVVGEAAYGLTDGFRAAHPQIPWRSIIGMRHRLVHDYEGVTLQVVWVTVTESLPALVGQLRQLLPSDTDP